MVYGMLRAFSLAVFACGTFASGAVLATLDGKRVDPLANAKTKAVVLVFTRSDCPISNRYAPEIERLYETFESRGVDFWLVYIDGAESADSIRKHVHDFGYRFGALLDRKHELVRIAKPLVTPEAAVYAKGQLIYRGRIDNRYVAFGKTRGAATEHDLQMVLEEVVAGRAVQPRTTRAVGCFIEDLK